MSKTWKLMKLAFEYFSLGFQRIIFMILGAQIAFLVCYLFFVEKYNEILSSVACTTEPICYPVSVGSNFAAEAMVVSGVAAVVMTIEILLAIAAIAMIAGYARNYLAVLSYYDEERYAGYKCYRTGPIPEWLTQFDIGKEAERQRLAAVDECKRKCKEIREGVD